MTPQTTSLLLSIAGVILLSPDVLVILWIDLEHDQVLFCCGGADSSPAQMPASLR
ncbi:MAG: hypothetical protein V7629_08555 [Motiliproteus sp.]